MRGNSKISFYYIKIKADFKMFKQKYSPYAYNQYFYKHNLFDKFGKDF